jgi:hypothetical protein
MKLLAIRYSPTVLLQFTKEELEFMILLSENHYDAVCRDASSAMLSYEGNRPGFLRGALNCVQSAGPDYEHEFTFRKCDTLLKILEIAGYRNGSESEKSMAWTLQTTLHKALTTINNNLIEDKAL